MTKRSSVAFMFICMFLLTIIYTGQEKILSVAVNQVAQTTHINGVVQDAEGYAIVSRIRILDQEGQIIQSFQTSLHGHFETDLEKGEYIVEITKGYEYERATLKVQIKDDLTVDLGTITLVKILDWEKFGYIGGDLHQHSLYSKDGKQSVNEVFLANLASGLRYGALSDHNSVKGIAEWLATNSYELTASQTFIPIGAVEISSKKGHFQALDVEQYLDVDFVADEATLQKYLENINLVTPCLQVNHPMIKGKLGFTYWDLLSYYQTIEIWNGHALPPIQTFEKVAQRYNYNDESKHKWFDLLNQGLKIAATASSDNHQVYGGYKLKEPSENPILETWAQNGLYTGQPATYVKVSDIEKDEILTSLKAGRSFMTNGPLMDITIEGASFGDTIPFNKVANMSYTVASNKENLSELRVIADGTVIECIQLDNPGYVEGVLELNVSTYHWLVFEVVTKDLGYAISNPIYIK